MKIYTQITSIIIITLILFGIASCKKETPIEETNPLGVKQGYFVIGSQSFYNDFNIDLHRYKAYSVDSSRIVHSLNLDSSFLMDVTINEYRTLNPISDSSDFSYGIALEISSYQILTEAYVDYQLRTRNTTRDTNRTVNKNSTLKSYPDTVWQMDESIRVPKLFNLGDTINWDAEYESGDNEALLFKYNRQGLPGTSGFEDVEIDQTDILGTTPQFVMVKYYWYPQNMNMNGSYPTVYKYGVIELSMNQDSTLKIHNVYTQK